MCVSGEDSSVEMMEACIERERERERDSGESYQKYRRALGRGYWVADRFRKMYLGFFVYVLWFF
jgi:hypothetical protein